MLENKDKKNPFSVPENYFQNFHDEIMNNLPAKEADKKKTIPLWKTVSRWTAIAAAVTGMAFVGIHYINTNTRQSVNTDPTTISDGNIESVENDYYLFLEDEATRLAYRDALFYE